MSVEVAKFIAAKNGIAAPKLSRRQPEMSPPQSGKFFLAAVALAVCFASPVYYLLRLAFQDDLYSDIPLIPLVSLYLAWQRRKKFPQKSRPSRWTAAIFFTGGILALAIYWTASRQISFSAADFLALNIFSLLLFLTGCGLLFLGKEMMRAIAFPFVLLIFTIPFPDFLRNALELFLQSGSAWFAGGFFKIAGTPCLRDGLIFHLPDINLKVAPECSGIHSTVVLFIVSLIAGAVFLRSPRRRAALTLAVIPLALIRNGFRIFVIGDLCVHDGPQMINSWIHLHGGPLFFALSLIPFFPLLFLLKKTERTTPKKFQAK